MTFRGFLSVLSLSRLTPLSQTILPNVSRGCSLTERYCVTLDDGETKRRKGGGERQKERERERQETKREIHDRTEAKKRDERRGRFHERIQMQTNRKRENERVESRASEKTTEREGKGESETTSPVSSSSILRKSPPKMAGRAKRCTREDAHGIASPRYHRPLPRSVIKVLA